MTRKMKHRFVDKKELEASNASSRCIAKKLQFEMGDTQPDSNKMAAMALHEAHPQREIPVLSVIEMVETWRLSDSVNLGQYKANKLKDKC